MKPTAIVTLLCLPLMSSMQVLRATDVQQAQLEQEAIGIVKQFGGALKPELVKAIKAGGPAHAISVCAEKAPSIAQSLSLETGWQVKRVSLKPRNAVSATPDAWETGVLEQFDRRSLSGADLHRPDLGELGGAAPRRYSSFAL